MAGPTASVLLKTGPTESQLEQIQSTIESISSRREGDDIWVGSTASIGGVVDTDGRWFIFSVDQINAREFDYEEEELIQLEQSIGYRPSHVISIAAMCNGNEDHRILGEIVFYFAQLLDGMIDFHGAILPSAPSLTGRNKDILWLYTQASWSDVKKDFEKIEKGTAGQIFTLTYQIDTGRTWASHVCDTQFMKSWLASDHFHMIK